LVRKYNELKQKLTIVECKQIAHAINLMDDETKEIESKLETMVISTQ
jgi:hypothetical protein